MPTRGHKKKQDVSCNMHLLECANWLWNKNAHMCFSDQEDDAALG